MGEVIIVVTLKSIRTIEAAAIGLLSAVSLSTCTARPAIDDGVPASPDGETERTAIAPAAASPLDEYLGFTDWFQTQEEAKRAENARIVREEDLTAQCMHERGFDYVPYLGEIPGWGRSSDWLIPQSYNPEWVAEYGLGLFADPPLQTVTFGVPMEEQGMHSPSDPNYATFQSLSPAEQDEWRLALIGRAPWEDDDWGTGCRFAASDQALAESNIVQAQSLLNSPEFAPLNEAIAQMRNNLAQPVITEEEQDWLECMVNAGYPEMVEQCENTIPRFSPEIGGMVTWPHYLRVSEQLTQEYTQIATEHFNETGDPTPPTPADSPAMADLQRREIALALADFDCRVATNFEARQAARVNETESRFVNDNRAALVALRDAAEQRGLVSN